MRLQPYQLAFLCFALFWGGVILGLMLAHGPAQPPVYAPFQVPL